MAQVAEVYAALFYGIADDFAVRTAEDDGRVAVDVGVLAAEERGQQPFLLLGFIPAQSHPQVAHPGAFFHEVDFLTFNEVDGHEDSSPFGDNLIHHRLRRWSPFP